MALNSDSCWTSTSTIRVNCIRVSDKIYQKRNGKAGKKGDQYQMSAKHQSNDQEPKNNTLKSEYLGFVFHKNFPFP